MGFCSISYCQPHLYDIFICRTAVLEIRIVALLNGCALKICMLSHVSIPLSFASCSVQGHSFPWLCWQSLPSHFVAVQVVWSLCSLFRWSLCWWHQRAVKWRFLCALTLLIGVRSLMCSSPIFHGCVNERLADRTPSPTFSTADSDITELADEQQDEMEDFDDEAFVDDTGSDVGTEEGSDLFNDGRDPFYDRSPWFILVGRLVRLLWEWPKGTSSCCRLQWLCLMLHKWSV